MTSIVKSVKEDPKELTKQEKQFQQETLLAAITESLLLNEVGSAKEIASKFNLTIAQVARLISSGDFAKTLEKHRKAMASVEYDQEAYNRAMSIIRTGRDKDANVAIKNMAEILGKTESKKGFQQQININLESLLTRLSEEDKKEIKDPVTVYPGFEE